ncbi:MAG: response regulator transcription factor [Planctomycetes bacterium]|nr:response regulator transcription factor [Planctomycetota bacterium]
MKTLTLPIVDATAVPQRTTTKAKTQRSTQVLLVEDEPLTAEVFARALSRDGHEVEVARDGLQALRRLRDRAPSLVVLDMSLPTLSGAEVVREIRAMGRTRLPIVVVSGSDRRQTNLTPGELWPGTWLTKPIKPRDLVAVVRELLQHADDPHHD